MSHGAFRRSITPAVSRSLLILVMLVVPLLAGSVTAAAVGDAGVLDPCNPGFDEYERDVDQLVDTQVRGHILVSFTAFPSFDTEWGVRLIERSGRYFLRSVRFRNSVWYSSYEEYKPHSFRQNPDKADTRRTVHEVPLSIDMAALLQNLIHRELTGLSKDAPRMGLDGETYVFRDDAAHCGTTWSPEFGTPSAALVEAFESLRVQAGLPLRPVQYVRERRAYQLLLNLEGSSMQTRDYVLLIGAMLIVVLLAGLPMVVASFTLLAPRRPKRKGLFVLVSGVLTYGITCIPGIVLLPVFLFGWRLGRFFPLSGRSGLVIDDIYFLSPIALAGLWLILSFAVPIYLRWRGWARLFARPST